MNKKNGFTLIELMIVIAVIGILIGATFKLMGVADNAKKRAVTIARMERLQNALSGYYAAYGLYPAVQFYGSPDPSVEQYSESSNGSSKGGTKESAQAAARVQPVGFEYPTPTWMDDRIPILFLPDNVISLNTAVSSLDPYDPDWSRYKGFKFGLMSFLLPRVEVVGLPGDNKAPLQDVYERAQWTRNNVMSKPKGPSGTGRTEQIEDLKKQRELENEVCMRWLPSFKNILRSFPGSILGVPINGDEDGGYRLAKRQMQNGPKVALAFITITDGWGREFFYHSPPPYQSYRVWSAGPDGLTFPPWIPSTDSTYKQLKAQNWIKDDIVGGKMQM